MLAIERDQAAFTDIPQVEGQEARGKHTAIMGDENDALPIAGASALRARR